MPIFRTIKPPNPFEDLLLPEGQKVVADHPEHFTVSVQYVPTEGELAAMPLPERADAICHYQVYGTNERLRALILEVADEGVAGAVAQSYLNPPIDVLEPPLPRRGRSKPSTGGPRLPSLFDLAKNGAFDPPAKDSD